MPRSYTRRPGARPPGHPKVNNPKSTHVRLPVMLYKRVRRVAALRGMDYGAAVQLLVDKSTGPDAVSRMSELCALLGRHRVELQEMLEAQGQERAAVDTAIDSLTVIARAWRRADFQEVESRFPDSQALGGER
jgi:hypothetical protein